MEKQRPSLADGERPTLSKFEKPIQNDPPSAPSTSQQVTKPPSLEKLFPTSKPKSTRPSSREGKKPKSTRPVSVEERNSKLAMSGLKGKSEAQPQPPKYPPTVLRQNSPPKYSSGVFKRWGLPYLQFCKKSGRPCSLEQTNLNSHNMGSTLATATNRSPLWRNSIADIQKFFDGPSLVSRRMMQRTACAAGAREPFPMSKARNLVFYQRVDKETFVEELESLKHSVADQAYHFQLHRVHIRTLRKEHHRLEERVGAIESIDRSEAPRTGGVSRLSSKVAGMQMKISCLENEITKHHENIQDLKYRYQVCLTREACVQRDMSCGQARRAQKEHRVLTKLLQELTAHNKKFLLLRDTIIPEQTRWKKQKEDNIQATKQAIKGTDDLSRQTSNEAYEDKSLAAQLTSQASSLIQEGKSLRAKLKYEREWKRKTQEAIWAMAYDTCLLEKNKRDENRQRAKS